MYVCHSESFSISEAKSKILNRNCFSYYLAVSTTYFCNIHVLVLETNYYYLHSPIPFSDFFFLSLQGSCERQGFDSTGRRATGSKHYF